MSAPFESRVPQPPRTPVRAAAGASGSRDRLFQALVALVDDLTVERDEAGLLGSALEHIVGSLELVGGAIFTGAPDGELVEAAEQHLAVDVATLRELATSAVRQDGPLVQELPGAGLLAATPLRSPGRTLGALVLHEGSVAATGLDREVLDVLGKQLGTGLANVQLYAELRASSARGEALRRITAAATSGSELAAIVPAFAGELWRSRPSTGWLAASSTTPATISRW